MFKILMLYLRLKSFDVLLYIMDIETEGRFDYEMFSSQSN